MEKAIEEDRLYDYIANNYYKMSQEDLKDIVLELVYAVYANCDSKQAKQIYSDMEQGIKERHEF